MLRVKKRFQVMIIPPSTDGVRQYSIPQWVVPGFLSLLLLMLIITAVSSVVAVRYASKAGEADTHAQVNNELRTQLAGITMDVEALRKQLVFLEMSEQRVRSVFGFPELDPAERALGTGGSVVPFNVAQAEPVSVEAYELGSKLDRLLRRCEFERENFDAIYTQLEDRKERLDCTPSIMPVAGYLTRGFGIKPDPFTGQNRPHTGLDLGAESGTPVVATAEGRVTDAEFQSQLGNVVVVDHGHGMRTTYGHLSKFSVKKGARVKRGDVIGFVGNTGYSTGPHLHYEVHINGRAVNPMKYIYDMNPWPTDPLAQSDDELIQ
ncbi:MAG: M23 family metallopeptidase [Candidatus Zixiibacteriota bacterium]